MAEIPFIDNAYIDEIIKAAEAYNPALNKTQGIKLRELIKRLRDRMEQGQANVVHIAGDELITGRKTFTQISAEELSFVKNGYASILKNPLDQDQNYVYTLPKENGELALKGNINKEDIGLGSVDNTSDINKPVSQATQTALDTKINKSEKAAANGVATLDSNGKLLSTQIPSIAITDTFVVNNEAAMLAVSGANEGDVAVRTDLKKSYILVQSPASAVANWQELLSPTDAVQSVNGYTGNVTLTTSDVSESGRLYHTAERVNDILNPRLATGQTVGANTTGNAATSAFSNNSEKWNNLSYSGIDNNAPAYFMSSNGAGIYGYSTTSNVKSILGIPAAGINLQTVLEAGASTSISPSFSAGLITSNGSNSWAEFVAPDGSRRWYGGSSPSDKLTINQLGYVGVLTTNPVVALDVEGSVRAKTIFSDGASGTYREFQYRTNGVLRWDIFADTAAESGANSGSHFGITRYADNGDYLGTVFSANRTTGDISLGGNTAVAGSITATTFVGSLTGNASSSSLWEGQKYLGHLHDGAPQYVLAFNPENSTWMPSISGHRYGGFGTDANTTAEHTSSFTYALNAPFNGTLMHFGARGYGTQFNTQYGDGRRLGFRTFNGDTGSWNPWFQIYHQANIDVLKSDLAYSGNQINTGIATAGYDVGVSSMLRWANYGDQHVIFDASKSLSPTGVAIGNRDPQIPWEPTYPTLMGWNGAGTYGVRVDSSRIADKATLWGGRPADLDSINNAGEYFLVRNSDGGVRLAEINGVRGLLNETLDTVAARNPALGRSITLNSSNTIHYNNEDNSVAARADNRGNILHKYMARHSDGGTIRYAENWWTGTAYLSVAAAPNGFNFNNRIVAGGVEGTSYTQANLELYSHVSGGIAPRLSFHYAGAVASQLTIEADGSIAAMNNPGVAYEKFKASSIYANGQVYSGGGSEGGFSNINYAQNHNNIWRLDNAREYGLGYYQNWNSAGLDYIGFHFGDRNTPVFHVNQSGLASARQGFQGTNYGAGLVGLYDATKYQEVFSMGAAYRSVMDGSGLANHYGIVWTHSNAGGESIAGLGHQALFTEAGQTQSAIGHGIWTRHNISANGNIYANGNVSSGGALKGVRVDSDTWFYSTGQSGLYSSSFGNGFYPVDASQWRFYNDSSTHVLLSFSAQGQNNVKGYIHGSVSGQFGFLNAAGGWSLRHEPSEGWWHANSMVCTDWFRSEGNTGWYNSTYAGGIHMVDSSWVRTYAGKGFLVEGGTGIQAEIFRSTGSGYKSYNHRGMLGDYDENGTTDKIIWTIGAQWNEISNMYGLGYSYSSKYANGHQLVFRNAGTVRASIRVEDGSAWFDGTISAGGDVVSFYSDSRLKKNLQPLENALDKISLLKGYTYNSNELAVSLGAAPDMTTKYVGLMAQDLLEVLPEAVKSAPFDKNADGTSKSEENYLTIQYEKIVPLLIEAVKELKSVVNEQEAKIKLLEEKN
ncbi:tail fiber domain-containing protein [Pedobacter steynii]|uniref:Peptidase S74 domain-containing protein n=1 Tax=Pedobacter steynii TaxID=430522 RepID=A0A1D7QBD4_9SPHI|nr:tail fiber domain-containing protein [Pedobacter steynii]AOM75993.1 hypothetical protein BFS30_01730 [Pedobacter steynii]